MLQTQPHKSAVKDPRIRPHSDPETLNPKPFLNPVLVGGIACARTLAASSSLMRLDLASEAKKARGFGSRV